ncbi:class Ib ribonucleoside-diphosphate reductase assembly flavoprotein NrdI [Lactobacillus sp. CC-MHH1034]|uniref:class Ib ribonucleoside-diphosphate reductase assembly flavoprotein NrdI n=1 Tax=Agrilactobacillus fermenti TaxID=2586909 RepID=UPI001E485183|nr:class Ib ribonucleoside-diphosphate reductase assembly flavoprotein NrdI [Agrilactobacillus fermenti]MCD2256725.1 class Ib ribonucleoside-diphosphate reductase assembly flavoprotein NrdI [Agrilactobacillus fermenti]
MNILYISISGNTRAFVKNLQDYAAAQHQHDQNHPEIHLKEISEASPETQENEDFFCFVPTYLEGGNGIDNGTEEIMTNAMREYIEYGNNASHCLGIIGSGNKNFNNQYCLTAKQYAAEFHAPFITDYELRGTKDDVVRIYQILETQLTKK